MLMQTFWTKSLQHFQAIAKLSRWKEHIPFAALVILGALLSHSLDQQRIDGQLVIVLLANFLAMSFAFMINDIEDAEDDAKDINRAKRNPVSSGEIGKQSAFIATAITGILALSLYGILSRLSLMAGASIILLAILYSLHGIRLKSIAGLDIISHSLMLGGLLVLSGYYVYSSEQSPFIWLMALAATSASVYGQVYNQLRDYELDSIAKLKTIAIVLGKKGAQSLMYVAAGFALVLFVICAFYGIFPTIVFIAALGSILISTLFRPKTDMRGGQAVELSGSFQIQFWIASNLTLVIWLIWTWF